MSALALARKMLTMRKAVKKRTPIRMLKREGSNQRVSSAWVTRPDRSTAARVGSTRVAHAGATDGPLRSLRALLYRRSVRADEWSLLQRRSDHATVSLGDPLPFHP